MIIAVDLDGFITEKDEGYSANYWERCTLDEEIVEYLKKAKEQGHMIKIFTSRLESECRIATVKMLEKQQVPYDLIFFNKPFYDRYFGDKSGTKEDLKELIKDGK